MMPLRAALLLSASGLAAGASVSAAPGLPAPAMAAPAILAPTRAEQASVAAEGRGKAFWKALAAECEVPAGESAYGLVREAVSLLGSRDSEWRDDVGYGVVGACVYRKKLLSPEERRALVAELSANLRRGIGEFGGDSVLLRSFSALDLSILAALELQGPALDAAGYARLLDDALTYLRDERDLRGLEPRVGWIHATAHTADLLKFLARDARFAPADHARLLDAAWSKLTALGTPVFTHAEDERLAAALVSLARRPDFDPAILDPWLERFAELEKRTWAQAPPEPATLAASQNARDLLRSFYVLLSLPQPAPTDGQAAAREKVLATLARIRR
jgi:hypothetical protein